MKTSVLFTGDAGGLNYIDDVITEAPRSALNMCCSCVVNDRKDETSLVPAPIKNIRKQNTEVKLAIPFSWNSATIAKYSNTDTMKRKSSYIPGKYNGSPSRRETAMIITYQQEVMRNEMIGEKYNQIFDTDMKKAKADFDHQIRQKMQLGKKPPTESDYRYHMEIIRQRIKFDVAWQIFDEINQENDTSKHIDLSCLDHTDAIAITKQKIFELASAVNQNFKPGSQQHDFVLNIKCAEDHLITIEDEYGRSPLKNCIFEMVKNEMAIKNYYIGATKTVLVHVDENTINIDLFRDKK